MHAAGLQPFPEKDVRVFPNPARNTAYLDLAAWSGQAVTVEIYDPMARLMQRIEQDQAAGQPLELDVAAFPNGIYQVVVYPEAGRPVVKKLVIAGE